MRFNRLSFVLSLIGGFAAVGCGKPSARSAPPAVESAPVAETPAPKNEHQKAHDELRKSLQKEMSQLEGQLPAAVSLDRKNQAWNADKLEELRHKRDQQAKNDPKLPGGFLRDVTANAKYDKEVKNSWNWKRPTDNAEKLRRKIGECRRRLVDLNDQATAKPKE